MPLYSYALGTTNPPTNLELMDTPVNPPKGRYTPWGRVYDRADGLVAADGYPTATWHFDALTQPMVDRLRTVCPGKSAAVYITTRIADGTFDTFSAVMVWPDDQLTKRAFGGVYLGIEIEFRRLETA